MPSIIVGCKSHSSRKDNDTEKISFHRVTALDAKFRIVAPHNFILSSMFVFTCTILHEFLCDVQHRNIIYKKTDLILIILRNNNIEYSEEYTKPQLLEIVNRNKPEPVYAVDAILKGHKILRLPPYHCDLNPIEMIWASMKRKVAEVNIGKPSNQMPEMVQNAFESISVDEWRNHCAHVKKLEEEYRIKDGYLDEPFIIQVSSESEESSDDDDCQDEDDEEFNSMQPLDIIHAEHNYSKKN